jgi:hypothetical protein
MHLGNKVTMYICRLIYIELSRQFPLFNASLFFISVFLSSCLLNNPVLKKDPVEVWPEGQLAMTLKWQKIMNVVINDFSK